MSHDIGTPIDAIIAYAELLDLGIAGALTRARARARLERNRAIGRHVAAVIDDGLDLTRRRWPAGVRSSALQRVGGVNRCASK